MRTLNISLTPEQTKAVDTLVNNLGFANRSEFFRALLRLVIHNRELLIESDASTFKSPPRDGGKILRGFKTTKKYSTELLRDLEKGLKSSNYFN